MATVADALILAALDTGRFAAHKPFPAMMYAAGYILLAVGQALVIWAVPLSPAIFTGIKTPLPI